MATIYLIRHGETTSNAEERVQGHTDSSLSELGVRQAEAVAHRLAGERIDAVYSSDLGRAQATAEAIASRHGLPVQTTPLLREACLGVLQGLTRAEIEERFPADKHSWRRNPLTERPPGAETLEQVIQRCERFLIETVSKHAQDARLAVVGHGGSVRGLIVAALGLPVDAYRRLHFSNASLTIVETGSRPGLWLSNDTCHLESLRTDEEEIDSLAH